MPKKLMLPQYKNSFKYEHFCAWLISQGAEVHSTTNPYEVVRYTVDDNKGKRVCVLYSKGDGRITWNDEIDAHYRAFQNGGSLDLKNKRPSKAKVIREKLLERDGDKCWLCGLPMGDDCTLEHFVPVVHGGPNHMHNYSLTHDACNLLLADKTVVEKVEMREKTRKAHKYPKPPGPLLVGKAPVKQEMYSGDVPPWDDSLKEEKTCHSEK